MEIGRVTMTWDDIYLGLDEETRKNFDSMPEDKKEQFIEKMKHSMSKTFENGIMEYYWDVVAAVRDEVKDKL